MLNRPLTLLAAFVLALLVAPRPALAAGEIIDPPRADCVASYLTAEQLDEPGDPCAYLSGRVTDAAGLPLADVVIEAQHRPTDSGAGPLRPLARRAVSDAQGEFVLDGITPGDDWRLFVEQLDPESGERQLRIVAVAGTGLDGVREDAVVVLEPTSRAYLRIRIPLELDDVPVLVEQPRLFEVHTDAKPAPPAAEANPLAVSLERATTLHYDAEAVGRAQVLSTGPSAGAVVWLMVLLALPLTGFLGWFAWWLLTAYSDLSPLGRAERQRRQRRQGRR